MSDGLPRGGLRSTGLICLTTARICPTGGVRIGMPENSRLWAARVSKVQVEAFLQPVDPLDQIVDDIFEGRVGLRKSTRSSVRAQHGHTFIAVRWIGMPTLCLSS